MLLLVFAKDKDIVHMTKLSLQSMQNVVHLFLEIFRHQRDAVRKTFKSVVSTWCDECCQLGTLLVKFDRMKPRVGIKNGADLNKRKRDLPSKVKLVGDSNEFPVNQNGVYVRHVHGPAPSVLRAARKHC